MSLPCDVITVILRYLDIITLTRSISRLNSEWRNCLLSSEERVLPTELNFPYFRQQIALFAAYDEQPPNDLLSIRRYALAAIESGGSAPQQLGTTDSEDSVVREVMTSHQKFIAAFLLVNKHSSITHLDLNQSGHLLIAFPRFAELVVRYKCPIKSIAYADGVFGSTSRLYSLMQMPRRKSAAAAAVAVAARASRAVLITNTRNALSQIDYLLHHLQQTLQQLRCRSTQGVLATVNAMSPNLQELTITNYTMTLEIHTFDGQQISIDRVTNDCTVGDILRCAEEMLRFTAGNNALFFAGKQLEQERFIAHYSISNGSRFHFSPIPKRAKRPI